MDRITEKWSRFLENQKGHYRLVVNELKQLSEEQLAEFPLSSEELAKIKDWAGLDGDPSFLGSGSMGSAYLFEKNNKVLKITSDIKEAQAAKLIEGKLHPNVYTILKVGRRWPRGEAPPKEEPNRPFVIVYDMVGQAGTYNYPNSQQAEVIESAEVGVTSQPVWTNWPDNFNQAKANFLEYSAQYNLEDNPIPRFQQSEEDKLDSLLNSMPLDDKTRQAIKLAYITTVGLYSGKLNTIDSLVEVVNSNKFRYTSELASGLTFLKKNGIFFKDLTTSNVMSVSDKLIIIDIGKSGIKNPVEIETIT